MLIKGLPIFVLCVVLCTDTPTWADMDAPLAQDGTIDLRNWNFSSKGPVKLNGFWDFYWQRIILPENITESNASSSMLIRVPGDWNNSVINGKILRGHGFATYHLRLLFQKPAKKLALRVLDASTAVTIFANEEQVFAAGIPGTSPTESSPRFEPRIVELPFIEKQLDLVCHVSNFHHRLGGLWEPIWIGLSKDLSKIRIRNIAFNMILLGCLVIMGLYHLGLYWLRRQDSSTLYFSLGCLLIALRTLTTGERYLVQIWPGIPWEVLSKLEYLGFYLAIPMFALFINKVFEEETSPIFLITITAVGFGTSLAVVILPARYYSYTTPAYQVFTLLALFYGVVVLIRAAWHRKYEAYIFLFGFLFLSASATNDILYSRQIIHSIYLVPLGLFLFILSQAFVLSKRFSKTFEQLKSHQKILKASEEKYRLLADHVSDIIWVLDLATLRFTYISPSVQKIRGFTQKEAMELSLEQTLTPESLKLANKIIAEEMQKDRTNDADPNRSKTMQIENYRKDGSVVWTEVTARFLRDIDGRPTQLLGITRDISERIEAEAERKELETRLQRAEKMEAIGKLAGRVAHDLNNILSGIVSYPDLLLMELPKDSPFRKRLITIKKSGQRAASIVRDLLTFSRRDSSAKSVINLNHVISEYLGSPEHEGLKRNHPKARFQIRLSDDLLHIKASTVHLEKMIMNLLYNAAESMPAGGRIDIHTKNVYLDTTKNGYEFIPEGEYVLLSVVDEGVGISETDLQQIFDPFFTKKSLKRSGSGLGTTIIWSTIKDHNGYIDVSSSEGAGTRFDLYLPSTRESTDTQSKPVVLEDFLGNEKILVVDDVKEQREIAIRMLHKLGYKVQSVASGEEAIEFLKTQTADLIILDMVMHPGIDGLETYRRIISLHPEQKAIIASGFSESERVRAIQKMGGGAYVRKPFTMEQIGCAVRRELDCKNPTHKALSGIQQVSKATSSLS